MNLLVTGLTGAAPVAVMPAVPVQDFGAIADPAAISLQAGHQDIRSECLNTFESIFGRLTLQYSDQVAYRFIKVPFQKMTTSNLTIVGGSGSGGLSNQTSSSTADNKI